MQYTGRYESPLGEIWMAADGQGLTGLWLTGQKYFAMRLGEHEERDTPVLEEARRWLDVYFSGKKPDFAVPLHYEGTDFQKAVWDILCTIPYGSTITYGEIAARMAAQKGVKRMSAQAVGGAVGHNPISIIVPCHRVVGSNSSLTGYAGGIQKKISLLTLEGVDMTKFFVPKKGTAL